jgi:DNA-binding NarL/FixJ family response regulator
VITRRRIRVLIADDHEPTRQEIAEALEQGGPFEICALARDAPQAVATALREHPDVCLLDVRMPGNGIAAAWEIHSRLPLTKIVMLTVSQDDADLFAALRAGASGYILKDLSPRRLPRVLHAVVRGEVAVPRALVGRIVDQFRDPGARRRPPAVAGTGALLTSREWQVLDLLRQELTTTQIARRLVVSPVTVRTHIRAVLRKLDVDDRAELLRRFGR